MIEHIKMMQIPILTYGQCLFLDKCFIIDNPQMFCKKVFLEISLNSQKNTCARPCFNKVAGLRPVTLLKKRLYRRCFPVNFAKLLRTPFLTEHLWCCFCTFRYTFFQTDMYLKQMFACLHKHNITIILFLIHKHTNFSFP